jgi:hypothetical protein
LIDDAQAKRDHLMRLVEDMRQREVHAKAQAAARPPEEPIRPGPELPNATQHLAKDWRSRGPLFLIKTGKQTWLAQAQCNGADVSTIDSWSPKTAMQLPREEAIALAAALRHALRGQAFRVVAVDTLRPDRV